MKNGNEFSEDMSMYKFARFVVDRKWPLVKLHYDDASAPYIEPESGKYRGHVYDLQSCRYVQRPFDKFYNHFDLKYLPDGKLPESGWTFTRKLDGAFCIVGGGLVTSMKRFDGEHARAFKEIINPSIVPDGKTWMFEYIGPVNDNLHGRYGSDPVFTYLASRDNVTGEVIPSFKENPSGYPVPEVATETTASGILDRISSVGTERSFEGWVGYHESGLMVKFKHPDYMPVPTPTIILGDIRRGNNRCDDIADEKLKSDYIRIRNVLAESVKHLMIDAASYWYKYNKNRKEIGLSGLEAHFKRAIFLFADGKLTTDAAVDIIAVYMKRLFGKVESEEDGRVFTPWK